MIILEFIIWVGGLGLLLPLIFQQPEAWHITYPILWNLFLGCAGTLAIRPIVKFAALNLSNLMHLMRVINSVPETEEEAKEMGITNPVDFALYMSTRQIVEINHMYKQPTLWMICEEMFVVKENKLFHKMFGRSPLSEYKQNEPVKGVLVIDNRAVECEDLREFWGFCIWPEAAEMLKKPMSELSEEDVKSVLSPRLSQVPGIPKARREA